MTRSLLLLVSFSISITLCGQKVPFHSAYSFGSGIGYDDEVIDAFYQGKYIYTTGYFSGSVDFAPGKDISLRTTGSEREEVYFAKYDTLDNLIWIKQLQGTSDNKGLGITADKDGNVFICGEFNSELDLDPSPNTHIINTQTTSSNDKDAFLAKYDSSGNFLWGFGFGGQWADAAVDIVTDANKNCILTGYFRDTIDIDPGLGTTMLNANYPKQVFLIQYDSTGKLNWGFSIGNTNEDEGKSLHADENGNLYLTGTFKNTVDFDPSSTTFNLKSAGGADVFIAKYSNKGALVWAKHFGGRDDQTVSGIAVNGDKLYICGDFEGMCDFDPSSSTYFGTIRGYRDLYISSFDTSGIFNWVNTFGANNQYTYGHGVATDSNGNCYIIGFSDANVDWDPSKKIYDLKGRDDAILASYDDDGKFRWAHKLGGVKIDKPRAVINAGSSIGCYGFFDTKAQFDPSGNTTDLTTTGNIISAEGASGFHARYAKNDGVFLNAFANVDDLGGNDGVNTVANDKKGNIYVGGFFTGKVDFDHGHNTHYLNGKGKGKILLAKYDSSMVLQYALNLASSNDAEIRDVYVDDNLNLFFTGSFSDTLYLSAKHKGKKLISQGLNDAIFGKVDSKGKLLWIKQIGGISRVYGFEIELDSKGNVVVSGSFANKVDFDPSFSIQNKTSAGEYDGYIAKYSSTGVFQWVVNFGNSENDFCYGIDIGKNDDIYATGLFELSSNFNPKGSAILKKSNGSGDVFVSKYSPKGELKWVHTFGSKLNDFAFALKLDENENVYSTGSFSGQVDFDPSSGTKNLTALGQSDVFLLSLDSLGQYRWAHKYGSDHRNSEHGGNIEYNNGRIYLAGHFSDTTDFDPSSNNYMLYNPNIFLAIMDTMGKFEEAHSFGSVPQPEAVFDISYSKNSLYLCGLYQDDTDFDPLNTKEYVLQNKRGNDGYLLRLSVPVSCHHSSNILNISQCGPYKLPSGSHTVYKDGTYYDVIKNSEGCDSNLTIIYTRLDNMVTTDIKTCNSYKSPTGKLYTESGTYYDTLVNQNRCDSVIITQLLIEGFYDSLKTVVCDSMYLVGNKKWVTQSGTYVDSFRNQSGCDSLIEIHATIKHSFYNETPVNACDQFIIPSSQQLVQLSGVYVDSFKTKGGCDSVLSWDINIHNTSHDTIRKEICDSFYLVGGKKWIGQSGTYHDSLISVFGCDSVITWNIQKTYAHAGFQVYGDSLVADSTNLEHYQWFSCGIDTNYSIEDANAFYYLPNKSGKYALAVKQGECTDYANCEQVVIVSDFRISQEQIKLFPNPTIDIINIRISNSTTRLNAALYTVNGKKLMDLDKLVNGVNHIDLSTLSKGSYILTIEREDGRIFRELVVRN